MKSSIRMDSLPSRISQGAAIVAIAAVAAAALLLLSLHVLSPEYSPAWRMVSEYANGHYSWVLSLMFAAWGTGALALAYAIRSQITTTRGKIGLSVLVIAAIGQMSAAVFDLNQVVLHDLAGALGIPGLPIAAMLISLALARTPAWSTNWKQLLVLANITWIAVILWVASFVVMVASFMQVLGALPTAPPKVLPHGVIAVVGWTNRLMIVSAWAWVALVAAMAIRLKRHATAMTRGEAVGRDPKGIQQVSSSSR